MLYSIDLPSWGGSQSGWLIPDYLRHRWQLITGSSSDTLSPLLERLGKIDIFLHDSDHSYRNMMGEFRAAWAHMETGVVLLAHNIDMSDAFPDFCDSVRGKKTTLLRDTGGIVKL